MTKLLKTIVLLSLASLPLGVIGANQAFAGGVFEGVDTTALLLVSIQMTASWLIPVLFVAAGFGIVIGMKFGHSGVVNDGRKNKPRFSSPPSNLLLLKKGVECTKCGRSFSSARKLHEHKRKVHSY